MKKIMYLAMAALVTLAACNRENPEPVQKVPTLTKIQPASGYVGDVATITGTNFSATASENVVTVGGVAATITAATETSLTITLPEHAVGAADVAVKVNGKAAEKTLTFTYLKLVLPMKVTGINPTEAKIGDDVVISGENFGTDAAALQVVFGEALATVKSVTETAITATVPDGNGEVAVIVIKGDETSDPLMFTYHFDREVVVSSVAPLMVTKGDEITITGTGFTDNVADVKATIGDIEATVTVSGEEGIKLDVPAGLERLQDYTIKLRVTGAAPVETSAIRYYEVDKYRVDCVIGNFTSGTSTNTEGVGLEANIALPEGIVLNPDGTELWVTSRGGSKETGQHGIHRVNLSTMEMKTVASQEQIGINKYPWGGDFNSKGEYHVCLKGAGLYGKVVNGEYSEYSITLEDGTTKSAAIPMNLIFDASDNMYVSNRDAKEVVVSHDGTYVKAYTGCPIMPYTIGFNPDKTIIAVGGSGGRKIVLLDVASGEWTEVAGDGTKPTVENFTDGEPGDPIHATVGSITGFYWDKDGSIYFLDLDAFCFRVLLPGVGGDYAKGVVKTLAGIPFSNKLADGDGLTEAMFKAPGMVTKDPKTGAFYMCDGNSHRVRKISVVAQ